MTQKTLVLLSGSSWADPGDTNGGLLDSVETLGDGGGGCGGSAGNECPGGGSGQYAKGTSFTVTFPVPYAIGPGGAAGTPGTTPSGGNGTGTWFGGSSLATCLVGSGPGDGASSSAGGAGGTGTYGSKTTTRTNGTAGGTVGYGNAGAGGAGAPGPTGAGATGGTDAGFESGGGGGGADGGSAGHSATSDTAPGAGGNSNASSGGGAAGTAGTPTGGAGTGGGGGGGGYFLSTGTAGAGGPGGNEAIYTDFSSGLSYGPGGGGGGGGGGNSVDGNGGAGGYGAGGGGAGAVNESNGHGGPGGQGFIVIKYTPRLPGAAFTSSSASRSSAAAVFASQAFAAWNVGGVGGPTGQGNITAPVVIPIAPSGGSARYAGLGSLVSIFPLNAGTSGTLTVNDCVELDDASPENEILSIEVSAITQGVPIPVNLTVRNGICFSSVPSGALLYIRYYEGSGGT
jgi:hypothetical protein